MSKKNKKSIIFCSSNKETNQSEEQMKEVLLKILQSSLDNTNVK